MTRDPAFTVRVPLNLGDSSSEEDGDEEACSHASICCITGLHKSVQCFIGFFCMSVI